MYIEVRLSYKISFSLFYAVVYELLVLKSIMSTQTFAIPRNVCGGARVILKSILKWNK